MLCVFQPLEKGWLGPDFLSQTLEKVWLAETAVFQHKESDCTGLLGEPRGGVWHVFSGAGIDVEHEKKVDLGVWGDADCHGLVPGVPFSMVGGVYVKSKVTW